MEFRVEIEREDDGRWIAEVIDLPDVLAYGDTRDQALAAAEAQFARLPYLHFPKTHQRWLKAFVTFARESAGGRPLAAWIADSYTPEKLKAWLDGHGLEGSYAAIFTVPTRSPYQW